MQQQEKAGGRVSLPLYRVSEREWANAPRTLPDQLLRWGGSLIYLALMAWCVVSWSGNRANGSWRLAVPNEETGTVGFYFPLLLMAIAAPAAGRLAPWMALPATGALLVLGSGDPAIDTAAWICAGALLVLGLAGSLSGLRLTLAVRRWRLAARGRIDIDPEQLRATRTYNRQVKWMRRAVGVVLFTAIYALLKTVVRFFTEAGADLARVREVLDPDALEYAYIPLFGILFWAAITIVAWAKTRIAGDVVLEVPLDPTIGPLGFARSAQAVPRSALLSPGCECGNEKHRRDNTDDGLVPVSETCPAHGIAAVNELTPHGFQAVAQNPWVWGANAPQLPVPEGARIQVLGLHGWGSRPTVPGVPVSVKDPEAPTHDGYRPWQAVEVWRRGARRIKWRDEIDLAMPAPKQPATEDPLIDTMRLDALRLRGNAMRVAGARPRFKADVHETS